MTLKEYKAKHKTKGNRICHMIGIPLIILSIISLNWQLFLAGWIFQFVGHLVFERNGPIIFGNIFDWTLYAIAIAFIYDEWLLVFKGKWR